MTKVYIVPTMIKPKPATPDNYELNLARARAFTPFLNPKWNKK